MTVPTVPTDPWPTPAQSRSSNAADLVEYTNPDLIALLRGEPAPGDAATEPDSGVADGARSPNWAIVILALAIASWAAVGVLAWLAWLVIQLL
jgi:hypothetical protein